MEDRAEVIGTDVRAALRRLATQSERLGPYSWVFLDPPYVRETEGLLGELCGLGILSACAVVVVEHDRRHRPPERVGCLFLTDLRQYGDTELSFFRASGS
jgi:16S rRNA G966 N2-methylase RsmD